MTLATARHREEWVAIPKGDRPANLRAPIAAVLIHSESEVFRLQLEWPDGAKNTSMHGSLTAARRKADAFKRHIREAKGARWKMRPRLR